MVGIVVVSHSVALAEAAVALAVGLLPRSGVRVVVAAGANGDLGTDATAVAAALTAADSGDGVLVLWDLGSAVLSAELALELIAPDLATKVTVSSAPLIEGLVAAVAVAAAEADLAAVAAAAERALDPKQAHLAEVGSAAKPAVGSGDSPATSAASDASIEVVLTLGTPDGLHARPAARLVEVVTAVNAELAVTNLRTGAGTVDGGSMLELMTLDARLGDRLRLVVSGPDAAGLAAAAVPLLTGQATER